MTNNFYVGIKSPKQVRRSVLTSSKNILEVLKMSQEMVLLRQEKLFVIDVLNQELNELQLLIEKLNEKFPVALLKDSPVKPDFTRSDETQELPQIEVKKIDTLSELERIETVLSGIEDKLKYLD